MARVKRGVTTHARHKKIVDMAAGYRGRSSTNFRIAIEKVEKGQHRGTEVPDEEQELPGQAIGPEGEDPRDETHQLGDQDDVCGPVRVVHGAERVDEQPETSGPGERRRDRHEEPEPDRGTVPARLGERS